MKQKVRKQKEESVQAESELEVIKRKLKKKELQTSILKKIIGQNDGPDNHPDYL